MTTEFKPGDRIIYTLNPKHISRKNHHEVRGVVVKVCDQRIRCLLTNKLGKELIKDVKPETLRLENV